MMTTIIITDLQNDDNKHIDETRRCEMYQQLTALASLLTSKPLPLIASMDNNKQVYMFFTLTIRQLHSVCRFAL